MTRKYCRYISCPPPLITLLNNFIHTWGANLYSHLHIVGRSQITVVSSILAEIAKWFQKGLNKETWQMLKTQEEEFWLGGGDGAALFPLWQCWITAETEDCWSEALVWLTLVWYLNTSLGSREGFVALTANTSERLYAFIHSSHVLINKNINVK